MFLKQQKMMFYKKYEYLFNYEKVLNGFMICSFMPQSPKRKIKFYANLTLNVGFHNKWISFCHKLKFSKAECRMHSLKLRRSTTLCFKDIFRVLGKDSDPFKILIFFRNFNAKPNLCVCSCSCWIYTFLCRSRPRLDN